MTSAGVTVVSNIRNVILNRIGFFWKKGVVKWWRQEMPVPHISGAEALDVKTRSGFKIL